MSSTSSSLDIISTLQGDLLAFAPDTPPAVQLGLLAGAVQAALGAAFCVIQPYDALAGQFLTEQFVARGAAAQDFAWLQPRPGGAAHAALAAGLLLLPDYAHDQHPCLAPGPGPQRGAFRDVADVRAGLGVALQAGGEPLGVLWVAYLEPHDFSGEEIRLARLLAGLAALIVRQSRLAEAEREYRRLAQALQDIAADIVHVAQNLLREALSQARPLQEFLLYVMDETLKVLQFHTGWLLLKEGDLCTIVATDTAHRADIGRKFPLSDSISGISILERRPINIPDIGAMPEAYRRVYKAPLGPATMRSELVVPLMVAGQAIGAFNIESDRVAAFEPRHEEMLRLLGDHVALAIELAQSREEADALIQGGLELARATDTRAVVASTLQRALTLIRGELGQVLLREGDQLVVHYTTNQPSPDGAPAKDLNLRVSVHDSVSGLAVLERHPVIVPDVTQPEYLVVESATGGLPVEVNVQRKRADRVRYKPSLETEKAAMRAELALPIFCNQDLCGVLNLETRRAAGFSAEQQELLRAYVEANASRFAQALVEDNRESLAQLLRGAMARAGTDFGQVLRYDGARLSVKQTTGGEPVGSPVDVGCSVTGRAVRTRAVVYVPDVSRDPEYLRYLGTQIASELAVPLIVGNKEGAEEVVGVLNIESQIFDFFTLEHVRILQAFAGHAAVALDRAMKAERRRLAEVGGLARDIVHQLNNPLGLISAWLEVLKSLPCYEEMRGRYPAVGTNIDRIEQQLRKAITTIQALRAEVKGRTPGPVPLQPAIREALLKADLPANIHPDLDLPETGLFVIANDRLVNVFWNLFDNARKAMPRGGRLAVRCAVSDDRHTVTVEVEDSGRGLEPWLRDLVFEGVSLSEDRHAPAHGLGLPWVRDQVEYWNGSIAVDSRPGAGTRFTITLHKAL